MPIDEAVGKAVDECIRQDILREFLLRNKAEVVRMSIYEYDEEATRRAIRDTAYERGVEDGEAKGKQTSIISLLEDIEPVPDKLQKEIMEETDKQVLAEGCGTSRESGGIFEKKGLMGIFVVSNVESGDGYSDILIESEEENIGIVIE